MYKAPKPLETGGKWIYIESAKLTHVYHVAGKNMFRNPVQFIAFIPRLIHIYIELDFVELVFDLILLNHVHVCM